MEARLHVAATRTPAALAPDSRPVRGTNARLRARALTVAVAAVVFWLAYDNGTYDVTRRSILAIVVWWAVVISSALALTAAKRPPRAALATGAALAALAALSLLSALWAPSAESAVLEANRVALYLGVFTVVVLTATRGMASRWCDGLAAALVGVAVLALASRLLPELVGTSAALDFLPYGRIRLAHPVGYWNALAVLVAVSLPLLLRVATVAGSALVRGIALAPFPALVSVLYMTSSRAGTAASVIGIVVFVALSPRRWAAAAALGAAVLGSALAIAALLGRDELVDGPLGTDVVERQGRTAAVLVFAACAVTSLLYAGASALRRDWRPFGLSERVPLAAMVVLVVAGAVAIDPMERFNAFRQPGVAVTAEDGYVRSHLLSAGGNGRWELWHAAVDQFRASPLGGGGAGSFQAWWEQHRDIPLFVRDAHSLFAEMLGELGWAGLLLIVSALAVALGAGVARARGAPPERRLTIAALVASLTAYTVGAGLDWMWEMTAVTVVAFVIAGLLTGRATATPEFASPRRAGPPARLAVAVVGAAVIAAQALPLLADVELRASQAAAARGDAADAVGSAESAQALTPWAASPYLQRALLEEERGNLDAARSFIARAIERDRRNWQLHVFAARMAVAEGDVRAARAELARAREVNPMSTAAYLRSIGATE